MKVKAPRCHVCWFSFSLDAAPLMQSITCAQQTMPAGTAFWVFDQATSPLAPAVVRWCQDRGVDVRATHFDRRRNLNGAASIVGQLDCLLSTAAGPDDVLWKVDCDTLILRPSVYLDQYQARPGLQGAGCYCPMAQVGWWGICYTLRQAAIPTLRQAFAQGCQVARLAEDIYLSRALIAAAPAGDTLTLSTDHKGGAYMSYNARTSLTLAEYARRFDIITFGDRDKLAHLTPAQQRHHQAANMATLLASFLP